MLLISFRKIPLFTLFVLILLLTGCPPVDIPQVSINPTQLSESMQDEEAHGQTGLPLQGNESPTLNRIYERGLIVAGVRSAHYPLSIQNEHGDFDGFDVAVMHEFTRRWLGDEHRVEFVEVTSANRVPFLFTEEVDILAISLVYSENWDKLIDFSQTYFLDQLGILVREDSTISEIADLEGKFIGVVADSNYVEELKKVLDGQNIGYSLSEFEQCSHAIQPLLDGRIDAVVHYTTVLVAMSGEADLKIVGHFSQPVAYGYGLQEGDKGFRHLVDSTLEEMKRDGTYAQIYHKWFGDNLSELNLP